MLFWSSVLTRRRFVGVTARPLFLYILFLQIMTYESSLVVSLLFRLLHHILFSFLSSVVRRIQAHSEIRVRQQRNQMDCGAIGVFNFEIFIDWRMTCTDTFMILFATIHSNSQIPLLASCWVSRSSWEKVKRPVTWLRLVLRS